MSISIADPFLLSTYTTSKRQVQSEEYPGPSNYTNVCATQEHASTSETAGTYVTVAVQGEGVHVVDTSTLHPAISHTLGPSVIFSCPSVSETAEEDNFRICTTYAAVETSQDVPSEERGRTVWMWRESLSGEVASGIEPHRKKRTKVLSHRVSRISVSPELPRHALFVGSRGELTITDGELDVKSSYTPSELHAEASTLRSFVFPRRTSTFGPSTSTPEQGLLVVIISYQGANGRIDVLDIDVKATVTPLGARTLPTQKSDIVDITCSETGWISAIARSGEWNVYQLETPPNAALSLSPRTTIPLRNFSFTSSLPSTSPHPDELSILSLGSSHVLLAGVTGSSSNAELTLLLWDLQYSVLLASHLFALPASVVRSRKTGINLSLSGPSVHAAQVLLALTSRVSAEGGDDGTRRTSVLVVPVSVPRTSTIANAVGRAGAAHRWVIPASTSRIEDAVGSPAEAKLTRLIQTLLVERKKKEAETAFWTWLRTEEKDARANKQKHAPAQRKTTQLSHGSVKRLLEIMLPASVPEAGKEKEKEKRKDAVHPTVNYSQKIVRYLLGKGVVSSGMVAGGLLPALRLVNDWEAVLLAIKNVRDIPESDLISVLHASVAHHLAQAAVTSTADSMQVDSNNSSNGTKGGIPSPPVVLALCVPYPVSLPALRLALRTHLRDADALTYVLSLLIGWLDQWTTEDVALLPEETTKDAHGALVPVYPASKLEIPPMDKILTFTQSLLDASLLTFLTHGPAQGLLRAALAHIEPELAFMDDALQLRGVLQPFVQAHARAVRELAQGPPKVEQGGDWRRRRKAAHEQAAVSVGVYQIEELVL